MTAKQEFSSGFALCTQPGVRTVAMVLVSSINTSHYRSRPGTADTLSSPPSPYLLRDPTSLIRIISQPTPSITLLRTLRKSSRQRSPKIGRIDPIQESRVRQIRVHDP